MKIDRVAFSWTGSDLIGLRFQYNDWRPRTIMGCFSQASHLALEASRLRSHLLKLRLYIRNNIRAIEFVAELPRARLRFYNEIWSAPSQGIDAAVADRPIERDYIVTVANSISGLAHDNYESIINMRVKWLCGAAKREREREREGPWTLHPLFAFGGPHSLHSQLSFAHATRARARALHACSSIYACNVSYVCYANRFA